MASICTIRTSGAAHPAEQRHWSFTLRIERRRARRGRLRMSCCCCCCSQDVCRGRGHHFRPQLPLGVSLLVSQTFSTVWCSRPRQPGLNLANPFHNATYRGFLYCNDDLATGEASAPRARMQETRRHTCEERHLHMPGCKARLCCMAHQLATKETEGLNGAGVDGKVAQSSRHALRANFSGLAQMRLAMSSFGYGKSLSTMPIRFARRWTSCGPAREAAVRSAQQHWQGSHQSPTKSFSPGV